MDQLVAVDGPYAGQTFPLRASQVVGRVEGNDLALPNDDGVSRRHARLTKRGSGFAVVDLGSSNGISVNGEKVLRADVAHGDVLGIGHSRFRLEVGPEIGTPSPRRAAVDSATALGDGEIAIRGDTNVATRILRTPESQSRRSAGLASLDVSQMGGVQKALVLGLGASLVLGLGYIMYRWAAG